MEPPPGVWDNAISSAMSNSDWRDAKAKEAEDNLPATQLYSSGVAGGQGGGEGIPGEVTPVGAGPPPAGEPASDVAVPDATQEVQVQDPEGQMLSSMGLLSTAQLPAQKPSPAPRRLIDAGHIDLQRAEQLRFQVIQAVALKRLDRLKIHLATMSKLRPSVQVLRASGLGRLLQDKGVWECLDVNQRGLANMILEKWREAASGVKLVVVDEQSPSGTHRPFGASNARSFLERVDALAQWLDSCQSPAPLEVVARTVAMQLVLRGFESWEHLEGLEATDMADCLESAVEKSLVARAITEATARADQRRLRQHTIAKADACLACEPASAKHLSEGMSAEALDALGEDLRLEGALMGVIGMGTQLTPTQAIHSLSGAEASKGDVLTWLSGNAEMLRLEGNRKSLQSLACSLRTWQKFAELVLQYPENGTLPPRSDIDVERYIVIFKNGATAANYVNAITWACRHLRLDMSWRSETMVQTLKGKRAEAKERTGGPRQAALKLSTPWLTQLVQHLDARGLFEMSECALVQWEFLLRVKSEGLDLFAGPGGTAKSVLWIDNKNLLNLKLQSRKNRPQGSHLLRQCRCEDIGIQCCAVHRMAVRLQRTEVGSKVWGFKEAALQVEIKRSLAALKHPTAEQFSFKAFRAGRATELAQLGYSLSFILQAGEWKSSAFLRYIDEDAVDHSTFLTAAIEDGEDEDSEPE